MDQCCISKFHLFTCRQNHHVRQIASLPNASLSSNETDANSTSSNGEINRMKCDKCRHQESDAVCYCVDCGKRLCHKHEKVGATVLVVPVLFPPSQPFSRVRMRHVKTGSKGVGYSPGMRRFSQFQSFTHFWHLGKLHVVNSILSKMSFFCSATPLQHVQN